MAVDSLQKTAETAGTATRVRGRPFCKGQSGNPAGRPLGSRNRSTLAAQLLLDGEAEALVRKAVELALGGDMAALRLCLDRVVAPRRQRAVAFTLPPIDDAGGVAAAVEAVTRAAAEGEIVPAEAFELAHVLDTFLRAIEARAAERRERHFWGADRGGTTGGGIR